jgi:hypothetical protein
MGVASSRDEGTVGRFYGVPEETILTSIALSHLICR